MQSVKHVVVGQLEVDREAQNVCSHSFVVKLTMKERSHPCKLNGVVDYWMSCTLLQRLGLGVWFCMKQNDDWMEYAFFLLGNEVFWQKFVLYER